MDFKSLHFQSVACPRMRTLVLQTMDFQSIVVDCGKKVIPVLSVLLYYPLSGPGWPSPKTGGSLTLRAGTTVEMACL